MIIVIIKVLLTFLVLVLTSVLVLYKYLTRNYGLFQSLGIPEVPSSFPFGSIVNKRMATGKVSFITASEELYKEYKHERLVGHFGFDTPYIIINDIDLAKNVMIKDFDHFTDRRGVELDRTVKVNQISMNFITSLKGEKWKLLRSIISPIFSSGKLKSMTPLIHKVSGDLVEHLEGLVGQEINVKEIMSDFTLDLIASTGFALNAKAFQHEGNEFRDMVLAFTGQGRRSKASLFRVLTILFFPRVGKFFKFGFFEEKPMLFLEDIIRRTLEMRRKENVKRGDLIDLSMDALKNMNKNEIAAPETEQFERDAFVKKPDTNFKLDEQDLESMLVANILQMFHAGFETTSTILSVVCFFLAKNPDVQDKVVGEILEVVGDDKQEVDKLDYLTLQQKLPYLDMVIHEATRHYPLTVVERICVKDYRIPGKTDVTIPKGMVVQIPTSAIMMDEKYFPNPFEFNPENFNTENKNHRSPYVFLAFGQGPRNCIGKRFAMLQMKIALVKLLHKFKLVSSEKTVKKLVPDPLSRSGQPNGGVCLKLEAR